VYLNISKHDAITDILLIQHHPVAVDYKYFLRFKKTMVESKVLEALRGK
jgi:hypothetical protein